MKGYLSLLFGSLVVVLMLAFPGNGVQAEEIQPTSTVAAEDGDCACHDNFFPTGSERNKMVANLLQSDEFKVIKSAAIKEGFVFNGAKLIEVVGFNQWENYYNFGVYFTSPEGTTYIYAFQLDGEVYGYLGKIDPSLIPEEH